MAAAPSSLRPTYLTQAFAIPWLGGKNEARALHSGALPRQLRKCTAPTAVAGRIAAPVAAATTAAAATAAVAAGPPVVLLATFLVFLTMLLAVLLSMFALSPAGTVSWGAHDASNDDALAVGPGVSSAALTVAVGAGSQTAHTAV